MNHNMIFHMIFHPRVPSRSHGADHRNGNAIDRGKGRAGAGDGPLAAGNGQRSQTQEQPEIRCVKSAGYVVKMAIYGG